MGASAGRGDRPRVDGALGLALAAVAIAATVIRAPALRWPADAEELALVGPFSPSEWATNPPLLSWLLNLVAAPVEVVAWGRGVSTIAAALAIAGAGVTARWAGGGRVASVAVAVALACVPAFVQQAALCRSYALVAAVLVWHAASLVAVASGSRRAAWPWVLTAMALPCLHYATVAGLVLELALVGRFVDATALRRARAGLALVVGVLIAGVLSSGSVPPRDDDPGRLRELLQIGWSGTVADLRARWTVVLAATVACVPLAAWLWRRDAPQARSALIVQAMTMVAGVALTALVARTRSPVQILWVVPCLPLLAMPWRGEGIAWGTARAWCVAAAVAAMGVVAPPSRYQQAVLDLDALAIDERVVILSPDAVWDMWLFHATAVVPQGPSSARNCVDGPTGVPCIDAGGRRWYRATDGVAEDGRWLALALDAPSPPAGCGPPEALPGLESWRTASCVARANSD